MQMLVPQMPGDRPRCSDTDGPPVVLLHGLWRGWRAMEPMARILQNEGFSTWNIPYSSFRHPIPILVDQVRREIQKIPCGQPVNFITHSLGCIILRALLAEDQQWEFGKIVLLAPPNRGSEIVDWSQRHPLIHRLLGPAGRDLGTNGFVASLPNPPEDSAMAVIMGKRTTIPFFRDLLEKDNDGIVSVSRGKIPGLKEFAVVDADHTFIQIHPETLRLSVEFLKRGAFPS